MKAFKTFTSHIIPLPMKDVDTDMIIPAQHLTATNKDGYGEFLFSRLKEDPSFVFNDPQYQDAHILVSGFNFGCGSSREHAVWALQQAGIDVVIAESFSDIFANNAAKNGLLLIQQPKSVVDQWVTCAEKERCELTVDLENQQIKDKSTEYSFEYDAFRKTCLLKGYDDLDYLLSHMDKIEAFEHA